MNAQELRATADKVCFESRELQKTLELLGNTLYSTAQRGFYAYEYKDFPFHLPIHDALVARLEANGFMVDKVNKIIRW